MELCPHVDFNKDTRTYSTKSGLVLNGEKRVVCNECGTNIGTLEDGDIVNLKQ